MSGYVKKNFKDDIPDTAAARSPIDDGLESRYARGYLDTDHLGVSYFQYEPGKRSAFGHRHKEQEEVYMVLQGRGEICVGDERREITAGQAVFLPPTVFHQLTNLGDTPLHMMYIYCPGGDVAHWRQELDGSLPPAGVGSTPPLPTGAQPQCTLKPA